MLLRNGRTVIIMGIVVALAAIAAAGWLRHPSPATTQPTAQVNPGLDQYGQPQTADTTYNGTQADQPATYTQDDDRYLLYTRNPIRIVRTPEAMQADYQAAPAPAYGQLAPPAYGQPAPPVYVQQGAADRYVERSYVERDDNYHHHHRHHGVKRALEYTAGGAGVGAAIGAIAGGGKGAGIGALAGGAGGFIYDRIRHH